MTYLNLFWLLNSAVNTLIVLSSHLNCVTTLPCQIQKIKENFWCFKCSPILSVMFFDPHCTQRDNWQSLLHLNCTSLLLTVNWNEAITDLTDTLSSTLSVLLHTHCLHLTPERSHHQSHWHSQFYYTLIACTWLLNSRSGEVINALHYDCLGMVQTKRFNHPLSLYQQNQAQQKPKQENDWHRHELRLMKLKHLVLPTSANEFF